MNLLKISLPLVFLSMALFLPTVLRAENRVLLIEGSGGEPKYTTEFVQTLADVRAILVKQQYPASKIRFVAEKIDGVSNIDSSPTLENITKEFQTLAADMKTSDSLLLIMIGQGQSDYVEPKFNLKGHDLTAQKLTELLNAIPAVDQRCILLFPCSGHFSEFLAKPRRAILASCDGPRQIYQTLAPKYFLAAITDQKGDIDKDGAVSLFDIYQYLSREVAGTYQLQGFLQNENPSLEDNANGEPSTTDKGMDDGDGFISKQYRICPAPVAGPLKPVQVEKPR